MEVARGAVERIALLLWTEEADSPTARVEFGQGYVEREDAELVGSEKTGWRWPEQGSQAGRVRGQTWASVAAMCRSRILPSGLSLVGDCQCDGPRHGEAAWHAFGFGAGWNRGRRWLVRLKTG